MYLGSIIGLFLTYNNKSEYIKPKIDKNKDYQWDDHVLYYDYGKEHPKKVLTPLGKEAKELQNEIENN